LHRHRLLYERSAFLALPRRNKKGCSREDLHLEPSPSHGDMHDSYTSGAEKLRHAGAAPARAVWKTAMRAATSMTWE